MNAESQRIALAKWMGFEIFEWGVRKPGDAKATGRGYNSVLEMLPNYPASLDACAEVEAKLTDEQHRQFRMYLAEVVLGNGRRGIVMSIPEYRTWFSATATQRCEALCRALDLWEVEG